MSQHDNAVASSFETFGGGVLFVIFGIPFLAAAIVLLKGLSVVGKPIIALIEYWLENVAPRLRRRYSETSTPLHYRFEHYGNPIRLPPPPVAAEPVVIAECEVDWRAQTLRAEERLEEERQAELRQRVDDAIVAFENRGHYTDESYIRDFARAKKDELLAKNSTIVRNRIMQHRDAAFIQALKRVSPETYERMQLMDKAVAWAEQFDVQPPSPPPRNRPKKPTTATAEKQRAERGRNLVIQAEDLLANYELREEIRKKAREMQKRQGFDSDVIGEIDTAIGRIFRQKEDDSNGKTY